MRTLLYPGNFSDYRSIEEDMREEYAAALDTGLFQVILFNYDEWLAGDRLRMSKRDAIANSVIYRGWMLKPEEYAELYSQMKVRGISLLVSPTDYASMHLFPNVYPFIKEDTAEMLFFEDGSVDLKAVKERFSRFMVKDSVKSVKGTEFPAFFDKSITQKEFDDWMQVFYKYRGDLLTGGICVKEFLDLKRYGDKTNEFRVFYANHQIISICRNSLQPDYTNGPPIRLIQKYMDLPSPYYTIDYAELADSTWRIIETGDGGVSGLSPGQDMKGYFRALHHAFIDVHT